MAHTYMLFDFGADEDKAQQARHKLEGWKQAYRLDKKLQLKFDRASETQQAEEAPKQESAEKPKSKSSEKTKNNSANQSESKSGSVKLLVRLYFSAHEKLSEQRSLDRILADELFKGSDPKVVRASDKDFPDIDKQFEALG
jgi:hypothetical protein